MEITVLCWNLFHGRDFPPDPELRTWRSRLLRLDESNETHVQVNRDLTPEFATLVGSAAWDVAMLQECPPRFAEPLARASGAEYHRVFTSRNELGFWRAFLARQNPDLMASGEGGSNTTLVRVPGKLGGIAERRELEIHAGEPERRAMAFTRTASGLCVANLHATNDQPPLAVADVLLAAEAASGWTGAKKIDHVFVRGLEVVAAPVQWAPERRELSLDGKALRLSDHAPIEARFAAQDPPVLTN
jgi:endonuclease/exonuclease/phosphatase family metal-dependent hydrolase